jgi:hypothetical protein
MIFEHLPVLDGFQMARFSIMTAMFAAGMFALGIEELWRRLLSSRALAGTNSLLRMTSRVAIVSVVIVAAVLIPMMPRHTQFTEATNVPTFFTSRAETSIPAGSVVLSYPYPDATSSSTYVPFPRVMLYQAVGGMRFKLIGGYGYFPSPTGKGGTTDPSELEPRSVQALFDAALPNSPLHRQTLSGRKLTDDLRTFLKRYKVQTVLMVPLPPTFEVNGHVFHLQPGPGSQDQGGRPSAVIDQVTDTIGRANEEGVVYAWFHVARRLGLVGP